MQCRYPATITLTSDGYELVEKPSKKMLQFDMKVETIFEQHELLKVPESRYFQQKAAEVVIQLLDNWASERVPAKIEVVEFIFNTAKQQLRQDVAVIETDVEIIKTTSSNGISVTLRIFYHNDIGKAEPEEEDVVEHVEEIIETILALKTKDNMFVSETAVIEKDVIAYELAPIKSYASLISYGILADFDFGVYDDEHFINQISEIMMGDRIYAKAEWKHTISEIGFYVDKCNYSCGSQSVDVIKV